MLNKNVDAYFDDIDDVLSDVVFIRKVMFSLIYNLMYIVKNLMTLYLMLRLIHFTHKNDTFLMLYSWFAYIDCMNICFNL